MTEDQLIIVKGLLKKTAEYALNGREDFADKFYQTAIYVTSGDGLTKAIKKVFDKSEIKLAAILCVDAVANDNGLKLAYDDYDGWAGGIKAVLQGAANVNPVNPANRDQQDWRPFLKSLGQNYYNWGKGFSRGMEGTGREIVDQLSMGLLPDSGFSTEHLLERYPNAVDREDALRMYNDDATSAAIMLAAPDLALFAGRALTAAPRVIRGVPGAVRSGAKAIPGVIRSGAKAVKNLFNKEKPAKAPANPAAPNTAAQTSAFNRWVYPKDGLNIKPMDFVYGAGTRELGRIAPHVSKKFMEGYHGTAQSQPIQSQPIKVVPIFDTSADEPKKMLK
jgi:hypothetical protein